jgi:hypothetical protein
MAAVARLTHNLSQERATLLAKEAIELSTAGNVQVRDTSAFSFACRPGFSTIEKSLDDSALHNTCLAFFYRTLSFITTSLTHIDVLY